MHKFLVEADNAPSGFKTTATRRPIWLIPWRKVTTLKLASEKKRNNDVELSVRMYFVLIQTIIIFY